MKCRFCNSEIEPGELYCKNCGKEVRIVPDYNPMDDVLEAQIKGSLEGRKSNSINNLKKVRETKKAEAARKKAAKKRKRNIMLLCLAVLLIVCSVAGYLIYHNSYAGIIGRGDKAVAAANYSQAESMYKRAIAKKPSKVKGYDSLAKVYMLQDMHDETEGLYLDAINSMNTNIDLYKSLITFYLDNNEQPKVTELLNSAPDSIREKLDSYIVAIPEFSLDDSQVYDSVQQITLSADAKNIKYTMDGSDPVTDGTQYQEPILLNSEGETTVSAVAFNEEGVPSVRVTKTYTIKFPVVDAPIVSPSTGQYDTPEEIEIRVPDGYTAYYTMDKTDPTEASEQYSGPVMMPGGNTIFKAIVVDSNGRSSVVTTRNYIVESE